VGWPVRSGGPDRGGGRAGRRVRQGAHRPGLRGRVQEAAEGLRGPSVPADRGPEVRGARRDARVPQARGPEPHRFTQDQQRAGPGAADQAHGQEARDRGDRRRPARCGDRDGVRAARARLRRLHGRGRHRAAGAERRPHAAAGRRGHPGQVRLAHAEGRDQRGVARLGHQRRRDALPARHGRRQGGCPTPSSRASVAGRTRSASSTASSTIPTFGWSVSSPAVPEWRPAATVRL
jgi:hypothetical protein